MTVTAAERQKKHFCKIVLDTGAEILLDRTVCETAGLAAGRVITADELANLQAQSDYTRAKERALWHLDRMDYTERQLREKLGRAGFSAATCDRVLANLKEYGVVDDVRYAARFAERCADQNISKREALQKMRQKGLSQQTARAAADAQEFDEQSQVRALLEKKYAQKLDTKENVEKVFAALCRKGFSFGTVRAVLKQYSEELQYSEEAEW